MAKERDTDRFSGEVGLSMFNNKTQKWERVIGDGPPPSNEKIAALDIYHRTGDMGPFIEWMDKMSGKAKRAKKAKE